MSDNTFIAETELLLQSETYYQLTPSLKVPSSITSKKESEIRELMLELQELASPLLDTPKMELRPESDCHLVPEKLSLETAEPPLVLLPEDKELINQS